MKYDGKLIIYTQFYKYTAYVPYLQSLINTIVLFHHLGWEVGKQWDFWPMPNESQLERSLNFMLTKFVEDETATDFLNIDADESWDPANIIKLLSHPDDIVCGVYRMTGEWSRYTGIIETFDTGEYVGRKLENEDLLLKAIRIPAGFMKLKKAPLQAFIDKYPDDYYEFADGKAYKFFWNEIEKNEFIGMDYSFSDKMRELGFDIWIEPDLDISHWGWIEHEGNLAEFIKQKNSIKHPSNMATIENFIKNNPDLHG